MTRYLRFRSALLGALFGTFLPLAPVSLFGQAGDASDSSDMVQREVWKAVDIPPAPPLSPDAAMKSFRLEPGFRLELVASEPLIEDPVAIAWDPAGRLWVAEMRSYMPNPDGEGEDEPRSRIVVLEDLDRDGRMDEVTTFLDGLVTPRALAIVEGGVLVGDPPNLYFCEDLDGDLRSDRKTKVLNYADSGNVEHSENGLLRNIDNWIYNAKSDRRFRWEDGKISAVESTKFRGQWGIAADDFGRLYYNHNSVFLLADTVPWEGSARHPGLNPKAGMGLDLVGNTFVHSIRVNTGVNRGYRDNVLRDDYRLKHATAVSGLALNRANRYPKKYYGDAFVPEPAGNVVARFSLSDGGLGINASHALHPNEQWGEVEFLASTDERFRPVNVAMGPDGFMYVVDMYRGLIQHKEYLTTYLREQSEERGLVKPIGMGRIYRIVHEDSSDERSNVDLSGKSHSELAALLGSPNGWARDTAQRLLVESGTADGATKRELEALATQGGELARIHALRTLDGLGELTEDILVKALMGGGEWAQAHVWQFAGSFLASASEEGALWRSYRAALKSPSDRVKLYALQQLPLAAAGEDRIRLALAAEIDWSSPYFREALVSGLHGYEEKFLEEVGKSEMPGPALPVVETLVQAMVGAREGDSLYSALGSDLPEWARAEVEAALLAQSKRPRFKPLAISATPAFGEGGISPALQSVFSWTGKQGHASAYVYTDEDRIAIARGETLYRAVCAACHGLDGTGQAALAPTLAGSRWVTGSMSKLALIVSDGLAGPIEVAGETWDSVMPPNRLHPLLSESEDLAAVLSYIRYAWGNEASPISKEELDTILKKYGAGNDMWTVDRLEARLRD